MEKEASTTNEVATGVFNILKELTVLIVAPPWGGAHLENGQMLFEGSPSAYGLSWALQAAPKRSTNRC